MKELIESLAVEYHALALKLYIQFILIINEFDSEKTVNNFPLSLKNKLNSILNCSSMNSHTKLPPLP